ncbi:TPA: hypothetical protein RNY19_001460 [Pasteurella multocida]|nr:hypothetical protein [Pasteurella multocida]
MDFTLQTFLKKVTAGMSAFRDKDSFIFSKFRYGIKELDYQVIISCTLQNKNVAQRIGSTATTVIPVAAPFAVSDAISSDFMEVLFKLGGN